MKYFIEKTLQKILVTAFNQEREIPRDEILGCVVQEIGYGTCNRGADKRICTEILRGVTDDWIKT